MEKRPGADPVNPELKRFSSRDPFVVLGLESTASDDEVKTAWRDLVKEYHPDINPGDKECELITQYINGAFKTIKDSRKRSKHSNPGPNPAPNRQDEHKAKSANEKQHKNTENVFNLAQKAISSDIAAFELFMSRVDKSSASMAEVAKAVKSPESQAELRNLFLRQIKLHHDKPSYCQEYINRWKKTGVKIESFVNMPEVKEVLKLKAVDKILFHDNNPDMFLSFNTEWNKLGVDLMGATKEKKVVDHLKTKAKQKIIYHLNQPDMFIEYVSKWKKIGIEISDVLDTIDVSDKLIFTAQDKIRYHTESPDTFLKFVNDWKKAGADLSGVVNLPDIHRELGDRVKSKFSSNKQSVLAFIQTWLKAGWKPKQSVIDAVK